MTTIRNTLTVAALAAGMAATMTAPAEASLVYTNVDSADAGAAEQSFLDRLEDGAFTESFENYTLGSKSNPFSTQVGDFAGNVPGDTSGSCVTACDQLQVLDGATSPFNGRFAVNENGDGGSQWLDSNDMGQVILSFSGIDESVNAFGFYLMDPADNRATLTVSFDDGDSDTITTITGERNGELFYIAGVSSKSIQNAVLTFENTHGNTDGDGFGIDRITLGTATIPAPATLGLLGAGLLGLGAASRRRHSRA